MNPPPPPPPPHGNNTNGKNGLPDGNYDIFIIPPHSAGGGFLYLPSLKPQWNSFAAGVVTTLLFVIVSYIVVPVLKEWFLALVAGGASAVIILLIFVAIGAWALGKTAADFGGPGQGSSGGAHRTHATGEPAGGPPPQPQPQPQPQPEPQPQPQPQQQYAPPPDPRPPPKPTWQRANTGPANGSANTGAAKGGWEKAREETRKKEEERRKAEELRKKREEDEKERVRLREKDAREREARERRERLERERAERKERAEKAEKAEKTERSRPASPTKNHHHPTAKTATDDDAYSYRPYDNPKRPSHKTASATASSIYSESSYAPSQSTSRTTPPPSHRGPYRSKDPDKIVIKAVYSFNNTFTKVPIAKLISGMGSVTDGLILRITTEGLFIDDDVRGVPQREWDVKAWTLKLVEVWCPHLNALGASSGSIPASRNGVSGIFGKRWVSKAPTGEETDAFVDACTRACKPYFPGTPSSSSRTRSNQSELSQSGEFRGLHVLRASIRDQEGKRYVFVLQEEEGWKVAVGLQRLRRGTQVRALGVSGMAQNETKAILENMGWV